MFGCSSLGSAEFSLGCLIPGTGLRQASAGMRRVRLPKPLSISESKQTEKALFQDRSILMSFGDCEIKNNC